MKPNSHVQGYQDQKVFFLVGSLLLLTTSFLWAFWPVARDLILTWYGNEDYSHGFFVIPVVIYLIWHKRHLWRSTDASLGWLGLLLVIGSILSLFIGILSQFRTLSNLSFIVALWGSILFLFGYRFFLSYGWEVFLLIFMVPIPSRMYAALTLPLQLMVTKAATFFLQLIRIPVFREGNLLHLSNTTLEVVNACSGLRSILTIIILSYVLSCLSFQKKLPRLLLITLAVPLAMLTNIIRVIVLSLFAQHGNTAFSEGTGHTLLGLALFVFSFLLLLLLSRGLAWVFPEK